MRLNLSDAVDDLAPVCPPACFRNRESWRLYLKSAAATQNHRSNQKVIVVGDDGEPKFNERLNYCTDCTQAKRAQMLSMGRCNPHHLSDNPDPPDSRTPPTPQLGRGTGAGAEQSGKATPLLLPGDAFTRLVGYLMVMGQRPVVWARG